MNSNDENLNCFTPTLCTDPYMILNDSMQPKQIKKQVRLQDDTE